ncbi:MAG: hypothetical protein ACC628_09365 [Pirellulaceae bacterium]
MLRSIGVTGEVLEHLDEADLSFQHPAVLWAGLVLLVIAGWVVYARQRDHLGTVSRRIRMALTATRVVVLAFLLGVLSGPYVKIDVQIAKKSIVAVLLDDSSSMQLPAGPFDSDEMLQQVASAAGFDDSDEGKRGGLRRAVTNLSRADLAQRAITTAWSTWIEPMADRFDLRFYSFADRALPRALVPSRREAPVLAADGAATCVGEAIYGALEEAVGRQVAGILVFTDGQNTGGRSPAQAARAAADRGVPIFVTPLGSDHGMCDLSVIDVYTSGLVAVGDTVAVHATLESRGFEGRTIRVELRDGDEILDTRECIAHDTEHQHVELTFEAEKAGTRYLTVHVPPREEESHRLLANNDDTAFVRISGEKLRVLFIDGRPRWDFRFIKNAIRRDHGLAGKNGDSPEIIVETEWRRVSERQQASILAATLSEVAEYHTVILGDVSPKLLTREFQQRLIDAVREKGVGLIVEAGTESMPHEYGEAFQELLPVRCESGKAGREAPVYNPYHMEVSPDGLIHEAMRLYDDPGRNQVLWARMPPYYWCASAERAAPGATVLAWNPSCKGRFGKMPLIAYHYAGEGKVMLVATDSTWLWRRNVGDRYFYKFWGQSIRFVARRGEAARTSWLEVRPVRAQPGEEARVELMAYHADGSPVQVPSCTATLITPESQQTLKLVADPAKPGHFAGKFTPEKPGVYRIVCQPADQRKPVEARMQVLLAPAEFRHASVHRPALELLAKISGGRVVEVTDLASISADLKGETVLERLHREATVWDNWLVLLILVVVFMLDVGARRFMGLS